MVFKNSAQLNRFLSEKCAKAIDNAKEKIYEEFHGSLNQFYTEFSPEEYIRTGAFFNSLEVTGVKRAGNQHMSSATAEIYFTPPSYAHGKVPLQSGGFGYSTWTDDYIFNVTMEGGLPHGGYEGGTAVWTDGMKKLGGKAGIKNLILQELKRQGL